MGRTIGREYRNHEIQRVNRVGTCQRMIRTNKHDAVRSQKRIGRRVRGRSARWLEFLAGRQFRGRGSLETLFENTIETVRWSRYDRATFHASIAR